MYGTCFYKEHVVICPVCINNYDMDQSTEPGSVSDVRQNVQSVSIGKAHITLWNLFQSAECSCVANLYQDAWHILIQGTCFNKHYVAIFQDVSIDMIGINLQGLIYWFNKWCVTECPVCIKKVWHVSICGTCFNKLYGAVCPVCINSCYRVQST